MKNNTTATLAGVLIAGFLVVACDRGVTPTNPTAVGTALNGAFQLRGSVYGSPNDSTIEGVSVDVSNGSVEVSTTTDASGVFVVNGLTAGTWRIALSKDGFAEQSIDVDVNGDTDLACELKPATAGEARRPARIR